MNKLKSFLRLTRMTHGFFLAAAVLIGQLVTIGHLPIPRILALSIITPVFISAGAFAINDYTDYETDKANERKDRPLVSGEIDRKTALYISLVFMPIGVIASAFINPYSLLIAVIFAALSYAYSIHLKKVAVAGNISIAASMTIPFIYGALNVSNTVPISIWILSSMAFLSGTGREIVKSIQDIEGDREQGRRTLPIKIGEKPSIYISVSLIALAMLISPYPYLRITQYLGNDLYLSLVALTNLMFITALYDLLKRKHYNDFRKETYIAIGIGLLAFLLPVL